MVQRSDRTLAASTGHSLRITLLLAALAGLVVMTTACSKPAATSEEPAAEPAATQTEPASEASAPAGTGGNPTGEMVTELTTRDIKKGKGDKAKAGDAVTVHYTGWLLDGTKFDSSVDRGQPFTFNLGAGEVIPGWDQGVAGMKVGGKRELVIPSDLAYGPQGTPDGTIPPGATLRFEVELISIN